jgi:hypothetical protein
LLDLVRLLELPELNKTLPLYLPFLLLLSDLLHLLVLDDIQPLLQVFLGLLDPLKLPVLLDLSVSGQVYLDYTDLLISLLSLVFCPSFKLEGEKLLSHAGCLVMAEGKVPLEDLLPKKVVLKCEV